MTAAKSDPQRRCLSTGEVRPKDAMVRFVVAPDRTVVPDVAERLPGHGYWVTATRDALSGALRRKLFVRAARREVGADLTLVDMVEDQLARRTTDLLAMARRAGPGGVGLREGPGRPSRTKPRRRDHRGRRRAGRGA